MNRARAFLLALLLGLAACGGSSGDDKAGESTSTTEATDDANGSRGLGGTDAVEGSTDGGAGQGEGDGTPPEPQETYTPAENPEPTESVIPMYEG